MADLSITASGILKGTGGVQAVGVAASTTTAGVVLYVTTSNQLAAAVNTTQANAQVVGIALHASFAGQPLVYQTGGPLTGGFTATVGQTYVLSGNAGNIAPVGDLTSGEYVTILGVASAAGTINLGINPTGVAHA